MGMPSAPPAIRSPLPRHSMLRRSAHRLAACTPTLHAIINGTASSGWKMRSRIAPATAEKAKPARPDTNAPAKTARLSRRLVGRSDMGPIPVGGLIVWQGRLRRLDCCRACRRFIVERSERGRFRAC